MNRISALATFHERWHNAAHDLGSSYSQTLPLSTLWAMATDDERLRWGSLALDYTAPVGSPGLRALIAMRYLGLSPADIICCAGAQEGMASVANALLAPGDHAVIVLPIYQPLERVVTDRVSATGVSLQADLTLEPERVAAAIRPNTRLVLINFPNSPTGAALDAARLTALVTLCRAHGIWLANDEVYRQTALELVPAAPQVVDVYERGISINSLSKGFGLPGLRVGWVACRDALLRQRIVAAKAQTSSCLSAPAELLAEVALREAPRLLGTARAIGLANRCCLDNLLDQHGDIFDPDPPQNLAFGFPRYRGKGSAIRFAQRLATRAGVLLLPSCLWRSRLGPVPEDGLRIALGQPGTPAGLSALSDFLNDEEKRGRTSPRRTIVAPGRGRPAANTPMRV